MKKYLYWPLSLLLVIAQPLAVFAQPISPAFNPNQIVPDSVFSDTKTFGGADEIQKFLEEKGSVLANTSYDFISKLKEPTDVALKQRLGDPHYNLKKTRTAAELIWDASQMSGLNPQVILVTLNKEQGLITSAKESDTLQRALNHSLGFACPDTAACDDIFSGFYFQLFGNVDAEGNRYIGAPASLMKSFTTDGGRGPYANGKTTQVKDTVVLQNTLGGYEGVQEKQTVKLENKATAALYRYTPHVFNGNYNFWRFYTSWFHYANGTILKSVEDSKYYIVQGNTRRPLPIFVAQSRKLNIGDAIKASPTELANYAVGDVYLPAYRTVVIVDGKQYLFISGTRFPATRFVLDQKKIEHSRALRVSQAEASLFPLGETLMPKEGTILRDTKDKKIYLVKNGTLKRFSALTIEQFNPLENAEPITHGDLMEYTQSGYVLPRDGTLVRIRGDRTVYEIKAGKKLPLVPALFANLKLKSKDVTLVNAVEILDVPLGLAPTPLNNTYLTVSETGEHFVFKNRELHAVSDSYFKRNKFKFKTTLPQATVKDWKIGKPL